MHRERGDNSEGQVKLVAHDLETKKPGAVRHPPEPAHEGGWIGILRIAVHCEDAYLLERDDQVGAAAGVKQPTRVPLAALRPTSLGDKLPPVEEPAPDLLPDLVLGGG